MKELTPKCALLLLLSTAGLIGTWYYNIQFMITDENVTLMNYLAQTQTTFPAKSFNYDLSIVLVTFFVWYIPDAIQLKIKHWWIFIFLGWLVALAFAFPLYLFFRERRVIALRASQNL